MGRVEAAPLGAIVGLLIGACFVKPGAPSGTERDGGTTGDGNVVIDSPAACALRDNFDSGTGCGGWGSDAGSGSHILTRSMGQLLFYTTSGSGGSAACQGTVEVPFTSVVVQIVRIVNASGAHTGVELTFDDDQTFALDLVSSGNGSASVMVNNNNQSSSFLSNYSGSTLQYVRFRKQGTNEIQMSFSSDGASWPTTMVFLSSSTLGTVKVRLYASFGSNVSGFVDALFDNLDGCAP